MMENLTVQTSIASKFRSRGFLPEADPLTAFPANSKFAVPDEIGRDLPSLLHDAGFRSYARTLKIPLWPDRAVEPERLPELRLYYVRTSFLASAYVNQVGEEPATVLPTNLAAPLCRACVLLNQPPILSYDGYALYNWKRFQKDQPIALGNIDTIQNFVHLYDEHWFILVHVEIEALAARILEAIASVEAGFANGDLSLLDESLRTIADTVNDQVRVLRHSATDISPIRCFVVDVFEEADVRRKRRPASVQRSTRRDRRVPQRPLRLGSGIHQPLD